MLLTWRVVTLKSSLFFLLGASALAFGQSASGPNFAAPPPIGSSKPNTGTFTILTAQSSDSVRNAATFSGDIFAAANAALSSCSNKCTVHIPAGTYNSVTTTLSFPVAAMGTAALWCDAGATINYTGSGYAIEALGTGQPYANVHIYGGCLINGTKSGKGGVHIRAFNKGTFESLRIHGFTNGDGWFNEGANGIDCISCDFFGNLNGIHQTGWVGPNAAKYSANAVHFFGGQVYSNAGWGIYEDGTLLVKAGHNEANIYEMVIDANGSNSKPSTSGNVFLQVCVKCTITHSYLETVQGQMLTNNVLLGDTSTACGGSNYCAPSDISITDNIFLSGGTITNSINLVNASATTIAGNEEGGVVTYFLNSGPLAVRSTVLSNSASGAKNYENAGGTFGNVPVSSGTATGGQLACIKSAGPPPVIGTCTAVNGATCTTCN